MHNGYLLPLEIRIELYKGRLLPQLWIFDFLAHCQTYQWMQVCAANNK